MDFYVENNPKLIKPTNFSGNMEGRKFGQEISNKRRALGVINQNVGIQASKRALSGKHEMGEKKQADPLHRPITRKFAAVISKSQPLCPQESNKLKINESVDSISIYIDEDCKASKEYHPIIPMFLEEADEAIIQEVEMDDIEEEEKEEEEEEPVIDIDGCDAKNPLVVVDYVDDLYAFYRKMEVHNCVLPIYMEQQFDINERMRAILIDWLIEVHDKFELMGETLFLTVNIIDRFLAQQTVVRKKLQLVGLVALLLACKYEEVSVPIVEDLVLISDKAYSRQEVLEMETLMLNKLQFNMSVPTPYVFMQRFLKASTTNTTQSEKKKLELLSFFLIELSLVEYEMIKFSPSLLAAAAIYTAQCTLHGFKQQWSRTCEWHSGYSQDKLLECSRMMVGFHKKAATGKLTGVYRKYSTSKHSYTSRSEAACFLLETREI